MAVPEPGNKSKLAPKPAQGAAADKMERAGSKVVREPKPGDAGAKQPRTPFGGHRKPTTPKPGPGSEDIVSEVGSELEEIPGQLTEFEDDSYSGPTGGELPY